MDVPKVNLVGAAAGVEVVFTEAEAGVVGNLKLNVGTLEEPVVVFW